MTVLDLFGLHGKVAVVTGASSGLGVAAARSLAEARADVALGSVSLSLPVTPRRRENDRWAACRRRFVS